MDRSSKTAEQKARTEARQRKEQKAVRKQKVNPTVDIGTLEKWTELLISRAMEKCQDSSLQKNSGWLPQLTGCMGTPNPFLSW